MISRYRSMRRSKKEWKRVENLIGSKPDIPLMFDSMFPLEDNNIEALENGSIVFKDWYRTEYRFCRSHRWPLYETKIARHVFNWLQAKGQLIYTIKSTHGMGGDVTSLSHIDDYFAQKDEDFQKKKVEFFKECEALGKKTKLAKPFVLMIILASLGLPILHLIGVAIPAWILLIPMGIWMMSTIISVIVMFWFVRKMLKVIK